MIAKHIVDWLSPLLGLIGSLALTIPFFVDFRTRLQRLRKIRQLDNGLFSQEDEKKLRESIDRVRTEEVLAPDIPMAALATFGCVLLVLSFLLLLVAAPEHAAVN